MKMNDKLLSLGTVLDQFQVSRAHWYKLISEGKAPKPIKHGTRSLWSQKELSKFIESVKMSNEDKQRSQIN